MVLSSNLKYSCACNNQRAKATPKANKTLILPFILVLCQSVHSGIPPHGSKSKSRCCCQSSNIKEQATGVFHHILNSSQEEHCLSSIDQPMIICQSNVHHWSWNNIASNDHWAIDYRMHSQDSRLQIKQQKFYGEVARQLQVIALTSYGTSKRHTWGGFMIGVLIRLP